VNGTSIVDWYKVIRVRYGMYQYIYLLTVFGWLQRNLHHITMVDIILRKFQTLRTTWSPSTSLSVPAVDVCYQDQITTSASKARIYILGASERPTYAFVAQYIKDNSYILGPRPLYHPSVSRVTAPVKTASPCSIYLFNLFKTLYKGYSVRSAKKSSLSSSPKGK